MTTFQASSLIAPEADAVADFEIRQGSDWNDAIGFDLDVTDFPKGFDGCSFDMAIRRAYDPASDLILRVGTATAEILPFTDADGPALQFYLPPYRTAALPVGSYVHVLRLARGVERRTFAVGRFTVLPTT